MAASGKKGRTKWIPVPAETVLEQRKNPGGNWEDEVAKEIDGGNSHNFISIPKVELPTAPKASRASGIDDSKIPTIGPFQAYISNIPYDLNEDELREVFQDLRVKSVRLPREEKTSKPKGFGYIEFEDRSSLSAALNLGDTMLKGRHIKIDLPNSDMGRGRGGMRSNRDRDQGSSDRTSGNWRSGPRQDDFEDRNERGYNRGYGDERRAGSSGFSRGGYDREDRSFPERERGGGGSSSTSWRDDQPRGGFGGGGGGSRGFEDRREGGRFGDREGGSGRFGDREGGSGRFGDREGGSSRFGDRDGGGSRFGDREGGGSRFGDRGGFEDRRDRDSKFGPPPRRDDPPLDRGEQPQSGGESRNRPKLQLQPRSKPKEATPDNPSASASIFGGAKPVDTAAREREIEERLMRSEDFSEARSKGGPGSSGSREDRRERQWEPAERRPESSEKNAAEPAPAPKENPWNKNRSAQPSVNNGRSSPEEEGSIARSVNSDDQDDSSSARTGDENRGPRTSRGPAAGGPDRPRGKESERHLSKHRERKESVDDISKMPKLPETKTPNFAGSNKYSSLIDSDEAPNE